MRNPPTIARQIAFVEAKAAELRKNARGRRDAAESWRGGTDEMHEAARKMAERMGGRKIAPTTANKREQLAAMEDRIAVKHDTEAWLYEAIAETLGRLA